VDADECTGGSIDGHWSPMISRVARVGSAFCVTSCSGGNVIRSDTEATICTVVVALLETKNRTESRRSIGTRTRNILLLSNYHLILGSLTVMIGEPNDVGETS